MTYIVIVYSNAFSFQFFASILSIMGYSCCENAKTWDYFPFVICHPLSDNIFSGIFHLIRQIVSFKRKQLLFNYSSHKEMVKRKRNHQFLQRRRVGFQPFQRFLVHVNLGMNSKPERASRPTLLSVYCWCLGTWAQPQNQREHQDLPFSLYILGGWELGHNLQTWKGLKTYPSPIQNTMSTGFKGEKVLTDQ